MGGEIVLKLYGAYCVIADMALGFAETEEEMHAAMKCVTRFLIRVNSMQSYYDTEVKRTNRIGVGLTGVHEMAWVHFGFTFQDLVDEEKSLPFWHLLARLKETVSNEAARYSKLMGLPSPHTDTTIKPAGTTSKLFGLTEGWHLPSMAFYMRWVQFRSDSPMIEEYRSKGYPTKELKSYKNTTIVGFPTAPLLSEICDCVTMAGQATPEQQYIWLQLGEKYWLGEKGNQISYTLKYDPKLVSYDMFCKTLKEYQSKVKCCSVMPQEEASSYEYLPEEPITADQYKEYMSNITKAREDVGLEHVDCSNGCPVSFKDQ